MNRAWIPAGALAGVSVAGLIALGPLTDSLGTKVSFEPVVTVPVTAPAKKFVAVSVSPGVVGKTTHAALDVNRGGRAAASTSGDTGPVAVKISQNPPAAQSNSTPAAPSTSTPAAPEKKKTKRPTSIGGTTSSNGDEGLASGGGGGGSSVGEQASKLGSDTNTNP